MLCPAWKSFGAPGSTRRQDSRALSSPTEAPHCWRVSYKLTNGKWEPALPCWTISRAPRGPQAHLGFSTGRPLQKLAWNGLPARPCPLPRPRGSVLPALPIMPCFAFLWFWADLSRSVSIPGAQTKEGTGACISPALLCAGYRRARNVPAAPRGGEQGRRGAKNVFLVAGHWLRGEAGERHRREGVVKLCRTTRGARGPVQLGTEGWNVGAKASGLGCECGCRWQREGVTVWGSEELLQKGGQDREGPVPMACSGARTPTTSGGMLLGPEVEPSGAQRTHLHGAGDIPALVVTLEPPDLRQIP